MHRRPTRIAPIAGLLLVLLASPARPLAAAEPTAAPVPIRPEPLTIGETFTLRSDALGETRRVNVYLPAGYAEAAAARYPVLYMPDGGIGEDFLHLAGLLQISALNGTMRPFLLVGVENTERRRDLTGPTEVADDRSIAPRVGGSAAFRRFLAEELVPAIDATYRTTGERALIGESLAGLFVVETYLLEPTLFDTYVAVDPSLWWNDASLVRRAAELIDKHPRGKRTVYLATSDQEEIGALTRELADLLAEKSRSIELHTTSLPAEQHHTVFHPAALAAVRAVFAPEPAGADE